MRKSTEKRERSDCSQGSSRCIPGYSRNSFSCSISLCVRFWLFNILLVGVDVKGHKLFYWDLSFASLPYFDSDYFICHGCLQKYMTPCLNVIILCFCLNPILHYSLCSVLIPWINTWSGGYLCLLISIFYSFLLRVLLHFYFILFLLYSFSYMLSESLSLHLGIYWGMTKVLTWEVKCVTISLKYWIVDSKVLPGAFLVILGILSHVRFLHVFVSEYLTYCWLVWTLRATSCSVEICCLLLYPILILIILCVMDAFRNI